MYVVSHADYFAPAHVQPENACLENMLHPKFAKFSAERAIQRNIE
jgi:hypothetical protein